MVMAIGRSDLGKVLKHQRLMTPMTLRELASVSGVSTSYLGRIENGERFPSASVLKKIAAPLAFDEEEIFALAGYLSFKVSDIEKSPPGYLGGRLDPYVSRVLGNEPVEIQRTVVGILNILKSIARV